jgi:hypothetical protein
VDVEGALRAGRHPLWYTAGAVKAGSYKRQMQKLQRLSKAVPAVESWEELLAHLPEEKEA